MKTTNETVYRCDFCNRHMFGKGAMSRHEKFCRKNPNNQHQCFKYCVHLQKTTNYEYYYDGIQIGGTTMLCKLKNVYMYSYKFEKNTHKPIDALNGLVRMPLECDLYKAEPGHDFNDEDISETDYLYF